MEQQRNQRDQENFFCFLCEDHLVDLVDLVALPCGHSYCLRCIEAHWVGQDQGGNYSCPLCEETPDHSRFLHNYPSTSDLSESTPSSSSSIRPLRHFEDVTSRARDEPEPVPDVVMISDSGSESELLLEQGPQPGRGPQPGPGPQQGPEPDPEPEPVRAWFLRYSCDLTLDPNTAHVLLVLSDGDRKVTRVLEDQSYPHHPARFTRWWQVLSRESLTGRCYWEVELRGEGRVAVAVAYKNISRTGDDSRFGYNYRSWSLEYVLNTYTLRSNEIKTPISGPPSSTVGVYLDHREGVLSFYNVSRSGAMTPLCTHQTRFIEPLRAGFRFWSTGLTAKFF